MNFYSSANSTTPIEKILQKKKNEKFLSKEIYEKIFGKGVKKTAEEFCIKPEEAIKIIIPIIRKNGDFDKFYALADKRKLFSLCEKMEELQTTSIEKLFGQQIDFAEKWEFLIAKEFLKQKYKQKEFD
jgi:hypothetical protein